MVPRQPPFCISVLCTWGSGGREQPAPGRDNVRERLFQAQIPYFRQRKAGLLLDWALTAVHGARYSAGLGEVPARQPCGSRLCRRVFGGGSTRESLVGAGKPLLQSASPAQEKWRRKPNRRKEAVDGSFSGCNASGGGGGEEDPRTGEGTNKTAMKRQAGVCGD